ncbi:hypothetical protein ANO11243_065840 [Dothideomycetidae sp. 11243]|nr:hypothetical protein ANO11243_065840 [fungal sp. No.11243]
MAIGNIRDTLRRKLSTKDKNPNFDEHEDADDEATGNLHREIEEAETEGHESGKPGSLLARLIAHGNKKTEEQIRSEGGVHQ